MRAQVAIIAIITVIALLGGSRDVSAQRPKISAEKLIAWLDASDPPLVLDVRGRSAYRSGTLAGALDAGIDPLGFLPDGSRDAVILIIPEEVDPGFIDAWFNRLVNAGHEVWILENGLTGWIEAGGLIEVPEVSYTKPGTVPFVIPRGLCEGNEPAQVFE